MKTIGLLGGMSWQSTVTYYRALNEGVKEALGGLHSAKIAMVSVDFAPLEKLQHADDWQGISRILCAAARDVQTAGADFLVIGTNTVHKIAPDIEQAIDNPLLHIADATAASLQESNIRKVGLLGTAFTMELDFYKGRLRDKFGLEVVVPDTADRDIVHRMIFDELCLGRIEPDSKAALLRIIDTLTGQGAAGIILGCTELGLLVGPNDTDARLFDTTEIHAQAAVDYALSH
ncbi:aspartate/glutamate racemase family protein [Eudoraea sp.]|uniref:aspartate/glutamate racemase family protein n=1 Tax=Eudoraea sp. TaxID=1979955 RepID=UPI003C732306